jgi:hypothetical protein
MAVQVLAALSLLMGAVMASSLALGETTGRDVASKDALAGALAGLDQARYRVNEIGPATNMCVTTGAVATGSSGAAAGECPAWSGDLGNGTTYGYTVTPTLAVGATCGGQTVASTASGQFRCITAYGTSDGVTRRAQALIQGGTTSTPMFPLNGLVALHDVKLTQNGYGDVNGPVGANHNFEFKDCKDTTNYETVWNAGPTATDNLDTKCAQGVTQAATRTTPFTLTSVDSMLAGTETTNDNMTVFGSASGFSYTASNRTLKDTTNATLIINGSNPRTGSGGVWTFNFCKLEFTHVTSIKLLNGAVVRILIDDDGRSGSGCPAVAGAHLKMTGVAGINYDTTTNTPGNPAALQIIQAGNAEVQITNQSGFAAALYAPQAKVKFPNKTQWWGAIAAYDIESVNGLNFTAGDVSSIAGGSTSTNEYMRTTPGFVECRSAATTATDPESGC